MHANKRSALIYLSISAAIEHEGITAIALAKRAGLSGPALTGLSRGDRPTPATVGAICRAVTSRSDAAEILCSHMLDEAVRAELAPSSVIVRPSGRPVIASDMQMRVDRIASAASRNPALGKLLVCLESMALTMPYDVGEPDVDAAADPAAHYDGEMGPTPVEAPPYQMPAPTPPRRPRKPRA